MTQPLETHSSDGRIFHIFETMDDLENYALELWTRTYDISISDSGHFFAALSGGNSPKGFYRKIAANPRPVQWEKIHLFLVDDRYVPLDHESSNARMIDETIVSQVPMNASNVHYIHTDMDSHEEAALHYEDHLKTFFALHGSQFPVLDFMLLGIGGDGHTASLFPGTPSLSEHSAFTAASISPVAPAERVTLTFPVINNSKQIVFIVSGESKSRVIERIAKSDPDLPSAHVRSPYGDVIFLIDRSAGTLL